IKKGLRGVSGPHQQRRVVVENRRILRVESQGSFKILAGSYKIAALKFVFTRDEIGGGCLARASRLLDCAKGVNINLAIANDFVANQGFVLEIADRSESWNIVPVARACGSILGRRTTCFNLLYRSFWH